MAVIRPWHLRRLQPTVYAAATLAAVVIAFTATSLVEARQLYGLWALAFLLVSMFIGPIIALVPGLPLKGHLLIARRPVGVSAFAFALAHVGCYLLPALVRDWHSVFVPGAVWIIGLVLGLAALVSLTPLVWTSRDAAVISMGGARWKRLHRIVYVVLPIVLFHAVLVGSDFGAHRALDVKGEPDEGAMFVFLGLSIGWLALAVLRARRRGRSL